ncbi:MAG: ABC-2 family transporter protein [Blastocatellia bacterium]|nr:ABC-2 family transporter protein [Blastocatellia bacterium]MBK6428489.1 ABC-2 family transporter protein [Blastocatellia bacterium]
MNTRLFLHVFTIQARKLMSYRADFWLSSVVSFLVELGIMFFLWRAVFAESGSGRIGGFTLDAMILYYVAAILLGKLIRGNDRDVTISTDIYEGGLTRYLLYPSSYFTFKYAEHVGTLIPATVQLVIFSVLYGGIVGIPPDVNLTPASVAMASGSVVVSNLLHFALLYPIQLVAFWADNVWSLNVMFRFACMMLGGLLLPLSLFPDWVQPVLAVLPFQYLFYVPATTLLGQVPFGDWAVGIAASLAWTAAIGLTTRLIWRRGTLQYTGVGI